MTMARRVRLTSDRTGEVRDAVLALEPGPDEMVAVFVAPQGAPELEALGATLARTEHSFFGGLFPRLVDGSETYDAGVLAFTLPRLGEPMLARHLDTDAFAVPDCAAVVRGCGGAKPTALVLADGMTPNISRFLEGIYNQLGSTVSYWGGGAGINARNRKPCVMTRAGAYRDAAVVALAARRSRLGVGHGWTEIRGPFVATRSKRNVIAQLNWENAFDVYRGVVERDTQVKITPENFYQVAGAFPFALRKHDQEAVVRCAVALGEGGSLVCVGDVPENAVLSILKGEPDRLVAAAGRAARDARPDDPSRVTHCLIADCISRAYLLGDRFREEMAAIEEGLGDAGRACSPLGALTLGEIASHGKGYLEYFNKTCVVASLETD
jgi:hypothetical protein